jgi:ATP-binding cassette subfamily C protein
MPSLSPQLLTIRRFFTLLSAQPRAPLLTLATLMLIAGLTEGIGILLLVPLIGVLGGDAGSDNAIVRALEQALAATGLPITAAGLLGAFLLLILLRATLVLARDLYSHRIRLRLVDHLRRDAFAALLSAEWSLAQGKRSSDFANLLITDVARVGMGLQLLMSLAASLAVLLAYALAAFGLSPAMTAIALGSGAVLFLLLGGHRRAALDLGRELGEGNRNLHGNLQEALAGMKLAKILGNEDRQLEAFARVTADLRERQLRFALGSGLARALFTVGGALFITAFLYLGLTVLEVPFAELVTLVVLFARVIPLWSAVQQQLQQLLHAAPALAEAERMQTECLTHREPRPPGPVTRRPIRDAILIEQLSYRYPGRKAPALRDIDLVLPARTTTAVMGPSGSGKSTLADLLMGLLPPTSGRILVDDTPLDSTERIAWRRSVAYVPQDIFLLNDSIRNNLLWARPEASQLEIEAALERAAAGFVLSLPAGLDTRVGERGAQLSGGERQRIALARALLGRPSLLILDEATSALDPENEERVRRAIENLHGNLTLLVIVHRLDTLRHADQVVVLDGGRTAVPGSRRSNE